MSYEEENKQHGQSAAPKLAAEVHTPTGGEGGMVCEDGAAACPYLVFLGSCVALVAFIANSGQISTNFAPCMWFYFVHRTGSKQQHIWSWRDELMKMGKAKKKPR